jgi:hypothetical protein
MEAATVARLSPWEALCALARASGWDARITHAHNDDWCSVALRARSVGRLRVIALWRGCDLNSMRFTSACMWGPDLYFTALSARELRGVLGE